MYQCRDIVFLGQIIWGSWIPENLYWDQGGHEMVFCDFAKYKIGQNKILISRNFAEILRNTLSINSFAKEILQNFVKYLFCEMILPKFRETLFVFRKISSCYQFCERNFAKFCQILISPNDFAEISHNFAKYFSYFTKFCRKTSFAKQNFAKLREILLYEILQNLAKLFQKFH